MEEFNLSKAVIVFFTYVVIDVLFALYVIFVKKGRAFSSALVSAGIYGLMAFGVASFTKNPLYLIPLTTGAFVGTYAVVRFEKKFLKP